jgi:hypothetical protein
MSNARPAATLHDTEEWEDVIGFLHLQRRVLPGTIDQMRAQMNCLCQSYS